MPPVAVPSGANAPDSGPSNRGGGNEKTRVVTVRRVEDEDIRPYVLSGELGKGSFATVYKGYNEDTKEQVAIKTVSRKGLSSKLLDNLQSEIDILKSLSHRHITKLMDIVRAEKNIYLIMEYCSGGDLTNYIKKRGKVDTLEYIPSPGAAPQYYPHPKTGGLDEKVVRSFLRQLARALKFLRSRNLIHRDIKPQNLLLKPASPEELSRGHPLGVPILKVADFGFARSLPNAVMAETLCGSPLYMAPEILRYEKYDAKADLWSVGAVLYETAVGRPPFRAQNHIELLKKIEQTKRVRFPDEDPDAKNKDPKPQPVPRDIKNLIERLLMRVPSQRASYEEFFSSEALKNSKMRPPKDGDGTASQSSRTTSTGAGDGETVVVGTIKKRQKSSLTLDPTFPESSRPAPPPPVVSQIGEEDESRDVGSAGGSAKDGQTSGTRFPESRFPPQHRPLFRRRESGSHFQPPVPSAVADIPSGGSPPFPVGMDLEQPEPVKKVHTSDPPSSTEASVIPGETEEDGLLRREYVMVGDNRAIEFDRKVEEIAAATHRRRSTYEHRHSSPTLEKRSQEINRHGDVVAPAMATAQTAPAGQIAFPPPPNAHAPPLSASPSRTSALTRALSAASKRIFGTSALASVTGRSSSYNAYSPYTQQSDSSSTKVEFPLNEKQCSPLRQPLLLGDYERDPLEEELLAGLEELAQKTEVLTRWADEMYEFVKNVPQKPLPPSSSFQRLDGETEAAAERRRTSMVDAEYNAVTSIALYLLLMSFSQKGIDRLRVHQEGMKMRDPEGRLDVSEGFDDALTWFSTHFVKCSDRARLVKTWLPETAMEGPSWLGQLVYDRALQLSRKAAHIELLERDEEARQSCIELYEESLWTLYALQDDLMQVDNPFREEDKVTISSWVEKTKRRLTSCRNKNSQGGYGTVAEKKLDSGIDRPLSSPISVPVDNDARHQDCRYPWEGRMRVSPLR